MYILVKLKFNFHRIPFKLKLSSVPSVAIELVHYKNIKFRIEQMTLFFLLRLFNAAFYVSLKNDMLKSVKFYNENALKQIRFVIFFAGILREFKYLASN